MVRFDSAFMTVREAAKKLGVSPTTAYRMVASHQLPVVELRRRVRVPRAALLRWIEARTKDALAAVARHRSTSPSGRKARAGPKDAGPARSRRSQ
jgi:excisionase family DNA binding protein